MIYVMYYFWFYDAVLWTFGLNILLYNFINRLYKLFFPYLKKDTFKFSPGTPASRHIYSRLLLYS